MTEVTLDRNTIDVINSLQTSRPRDLPDSRQHRTVMDHPFDFAVTDNHSYSPDALYTGIGGESWRTTVRLPLWIEELFGQIKRLFPAYETPSDLIRDALVHRLHSLQSDDPSFLALREQYETWAGIQAEATQQVAIRETFDACNRAWTRAETDVEVMRVRQRIQDVVDKTLDPEWQRRFESIVKK